MGNIILTRCPCSFSATCQGSSSPAMRAPWSPPSCIARWEKVQKRNMQFIARWKKYRKHICNALPGEKIQKSTENTYAMHCQVKKYRKYIKHAIHCQVKKYKRNTENTMHYQAKNKGITPIWYLYAMASVQLLQVSNSVGCYKTLTCRTLVRHSSCQGWLDSHKNSPVIAMDTLCLNIDITIINDLIQTSQSVCIRPYNS